MNYGYDDLYRLTSETIAGATSQNGAVSYTYDSVGNRLQRNSTVAAIPATGLLNYDTNDRTSTDPYDANGNLLNGGVGSNVYDFENHLVAAGGVSLVYDGDGNRVKETVATTTTSFLVADQNLTGYAQVMDELQAGAVSRTYSYGLELINEHQSIAGTPTTSFYGYDGHGSVRFLTSSTGAVTDTYDYDAFGTKISSSGSTPNNYLFAGEQFDPALGIYYNRARYYDQRQGRFWTMDTWEGDPESPVSLHLYLYANANPVNRTDRSGHESLAEIDISEAIEETLNAISGVQKMIRVKDEISTVLDLLSAVKDLGVLLASEGSGGLFDMASKIESVAFDKLGKEALNLPLMLFDSVSRNAAKIATTNLLSPAKDISIARAFSASDASILLYIPGVVGRIAEFPTGLRVAGRPLKITSQGGMALLGMGFAGAGTSVQLFHVDLVIPLKPGHTGPNGTDLDAWYDGPLLNYQVPRN